VVEIPMREWMAMTMAIQHETGPRVELIPVVEGPGGQ
jgi:hypothetical protein